MAERQARQGDAPLGYSLTDLHMRVTMVHTLMKGRLRPQAASLGLGPGQPRMLSYLAVHGPCTQRDIALYYRIDPAAVSRMLDALEKGGFIRMAAGEDRRKKVASLTQLGKDALRTWDAMCAAADTAMLEGFTVAERAQLETLLDRLVENLGQPLSSDRGKGEGSTSASTPSEAAGTEPSHA